jgi:hypothetical protein
LYASLPWTLSKRPKARVLVLTGILPLLEERSGAERHELYYVEA